MWLKLCSGEVNIAVVRRVDQTERELEQRDQPWGNEGPNCDGGSEKVKGVDEVKRCYRDKLTEFCN